MEIAYNGVLLSIASQLQFIYFLYLMSYGNGQLLLTLQLGPYYPTYYYNY